MKRAVLVSALMLTAISILEVPAVAATRPKRVSGAALRYAAGSGAASRTAADTASAPSIGSNVEMNQDEAAHPTSPHNEVAVAVNPANGNNVVAGANDYRQGTGGESGWYTTSNGGSTWSDGTFVPGGVMPSGVDSAGDPSLAFTSNGSRLYYSQIAFKQIMPDDGGCDTDSGVYVSTSTNQGSSWGAATKVAANDLTIFNDKPWVTVDGTSFVFVTYSKFVFTLPTDCVAKNTGDSPIKLKRSTDGGQTWGSEVDVSGSYTASQGSAPAVAPNGDLYVAFEGGGSLCSDCIVVARSTDHGQSFSSQTKVSDITGLVTIKATTGGASVRADSFPSLAISPGGALFVTWAETRGNSTDADVWLSTSTNGTTWSNPARVNQVTTGDQFFPSVAVDSDSTVWVSYSDRRGDPNNVLYKQYVSHSHDGGSTWTDTAVATTASDPGAVVFSSGEYFIGDYNGIAAVPGGGAFTTWCDTRRTDGNGGQEDAFGSHITTTGQTSLTGSLSPTVGVIGTAFTLSGKLVAGVTGADGKTIQVQRRAIGSSTWVSVGQATTANGGNYSLGLGKPSATTDYRAVFAGDSNFLPATSPTVRAGVRVGIIFNPTTSTSLPRGTTARFGGSVIPNHAGKRVQLQVLTGSGWSTIQTITLDGNSHYSASARITTSGNRLYRIIYATQDSDHVWNVSRSISVHWA